MDVNGYLDLVPSENSRKEKFMSFLEGIITPGIQLQNVIQNSRAFDVNSAVGRSLDILGEYIGVSRDLDYLPATGETVLGDTDYSMLVRMRVAQESWSGTNKDVMDVYSIASGNDVNFVYNDNMDGSIDIEADVMIQSIILALNSNKEFLLPAGVNLNLDINDSMLTSNMYLGIAVTGISFSDRLVIGG